MENFVKAEINSHIAIITFGTPKSNALPGSILEQLAETIKSQAALPQVKALLLQSAGDRVFCAGASFDELLEIEDLDASKKFFGGFAKVLQAMRTCGKIVVVRVQGKATGGGVGIACAADYCFATKDSALALTEINIGIGPFVIGPYVERKIGKSAFTAMALDAGFRSAEWAQQQGVYQYVGADIADMDRQLQTFLQYISEKSSEALGLLKKVSWEGSAHFDELMPQRIAMSAALVLKEEAKQSIQKVKERLKEK